jgi:general secretion pathway protein K
MNQRLLNQRLSARSSLKRQRGVAVVTALLLTTLAITIVASLFWQQQVQVRSIENQRLQLQKQWILRGALDWTRLILREDYRYSRGLDHLGEPWAVPLAETRLDQYVDNARSETDVPDAVLSGGVTDAQARFNLTNLSLGGTPDPLEVMAFGRLLTNVRQNPGLALATANLMASTQTRETRTPQGQGGTQQTQGTQGTQGTQTQGTQTQGAQSAQGTQATQGAQASAASDGPKPIQILHVDDLLAVPGFTPEALAAIKDFVIVLPTRTKVNVNTASAEVLAARIDTLSLPEATALVAGRQTMHFRNISDFKQRLPDKQLPDAQIGVSTEYFLVNGNVRLSRATMRMQALIERKDLNTRVVWIREN